MLFNKAKKQRDIVEAHLRQVCILLEHSKQDNISDEITQNYISQKLALAYVLRDFDKLDSE